MRNIPELEGGIEPAAGGADSNPEDDVVPEGGRLDLRGSRASFGTGGGTLTRPGGALLRSGAAMVPGRVNSPVTSVASSCSSSRV